MFYLQGLNKSYKQSHAKTIILDGCVNPCVHQFATCYELKLYRRRENFIIKSISLVAYNDENQMHENFQRRSDEVRIALLGYMKPICSLPDHCRLFFVSHVTTAHEYVQLSVSLTPGIIYYVYVHVIYCDCHVS